MSPRPTVEARPSVFAACGSLRLRIPLPSGIVAVGLAPDLADDVQQTLRQWIPVHEVRNVRGCVMLLERHVGLCVVFPVPSSTEDQLGEHLLRLRAEFPHVPSVALFLETSSSSRWAMRLGTAGVTELVSATSSVPGSALMSALSRCEMESVGVRLWKRAELTMPEALLPVLKTAIRLAHEPVSLVRLAGAARMHERTLRKYCDHSALPSPQWIIGWARLLVAAYYLEEPGRTIQSIAELLHFPSAVALANQIRRYTGLRPSVVRAQGAVQTIARLFERVVREHSMTCLTRQASGAPPRV